jgi:hypothetical protein
MTERIEEFSLDGKNFLYLDVSGLKTNGEFIRIIEEAKPIVRKYAENSLYTITNIQHIRFDTKTKEIVTEWTAHNKPYVKHGVVIGMDGIKKIMANAVFALSGRTNMSAAASKEQAVELILKKE